MARIPRTAIGGRVQRAGIPGGTSNISATAEDFGAIQGRALEKIGAQGRRTLETGVRVASALQEQGRKVKHDTDQSIAGNFFLAYSEEARNIENQALNQLKGNARGVPQKTEEALTKLQIESDTRLENDEQRAMFQSLINPLKNSTLRRVDTHTRGQLQAFKKSTFAAMVENNAEYGAVHIGDEQARSDAEFNIRLSVAQGNEGASAEELKALEGAVVSGMYVNGITLLMATDAQQAKTVFDQNKEKISADKRDDLEIAINKEDVSQTSKIQATNIMAEFDDFEQQIELAREIEDADLSDATVARIKTRQKEIKQLKKENLVKENDTITGRVLDAKTLEQALEAANDAPTEADKKLHIAHANARFKEKTEKVVTDPTIEEEVNRAVTQGKIKTSEHYIRSTKGKMSSKDIQKGLKFLSQDGEVGGVKEPALRSKFTELMNKTPREDPHTYKLARDFVIDQIVATGKPATPTNIDEWMGQALLSGFETESLDKFFSFDTETTLVEAIERRVPFTTEITEIERTNIVSDIQALNATLPLNERINITEDYIEIIFLRDEGFSEEQIRTIMGL